MSSDSADSQLPLGIGNEAFERWHNLKSIVYLPEQLQPAQNAIAKLCNHLFSSTRLHLAWLGSALASFSDSSHFILSLSLCDADQSNYRGAGCNDFICHPPESSPSSSSSSSGNPLEFLLTVVVVVLLSVFVVVVK